MGLSPLIARPPQRFLRARVDHIRGTYCSAHEAAQGDEFDNFSAVADLLLNGKEDFLRSFRHVVILTRLSGAPQHFGSCLLEAAQTPKQNAEEKSVDRVRESDVSLS